MSSDPRVYGGRTKEKWKIESKLRYRAQRKQQRRAKAAAETPSDRWGRRQGWAMRGKVSANSFLPVLLLLKSGEPATRATRTIFSIACFDSAHT